MYSAVNQSWLWIIVKVTIFPYLRYCNLIIIELLRLIVVNHTVFFLWVVTDLTGEHRGDKYLTPTYTTFALILITKAKRREMSFNDIGEYAKKHHDNHQHRTQGGCNPSYETFQSHVPNGTKMSSYETLLLEKDKLESLRPIQQRLMLRNHFIVLAQKFHPDKNSKAKNWMHRYYEHH